MLMVFFILTLDQYNLDKHRQIFKTFLLFVTVVYIFIPGQFSCIHFLRFIFQPIRIKFCIGIENKVRNKIMLGDKGKLIFVCYSKLKQSKFKKCGF